MARKSSATRAPANGGLPSKEQILEFLNSAPGKAGKREIARAFGVSGGARIALKRLLAEMAEDGSLAGDKKHLREKGKLPPVTTLEITGRDDDGDLIAKPLNWEESDGKRPVVRVLAARDGRDAEIGIGDHVLARLEKLPRGGGAASYEATPIKKLPREKRRLLGIFRASKRGGGTIEPIDRKELKSWPILPGDMGGAKDGDLVRFELVRSGRFATPRAEVVESLGNPDDQRKISLIAIHAHGIPEDFPESVLKECETLLAADDGRTHRSQKHSVVDHRPHRRPRPRRRGARRARPGLEKFRRLHRHGRHRRRRPVYPPRFEARSRGAAPRQLGLFPGSRRPDAAGEDLERPLLVTRT